MKLPLAILTVTLLFVTAIPTYGAVFQCVSQIPVADGESTGTIREILPAEDGVHLVGAANGLYALKGERLMQISVADGGHTGAIYKILPAEDGVHLIGAASGLYALKGERLVQIPVADGGHTGGVGEILPAEDGVRLIGASKGLFELKGERLVLIPVADGGSTGAIFLILPAEDGVRLIGAANGLFSLKGERLVQIYFADGEPIKDIREILPAKDGVHLLGAHNGLYALKGGRLVQIVADGEPTGTIREILPAEDGIYLISAGRGLFALKGERLVQIPVADGGRIGNTLEILPAEDGVRLIGAANGLFALKGEWLVQIPVAEGEPIKDIGEILPVEDGVHLIGARNGLFELKGERLVQIPVADEPTGFINKILPAKDGVHLIGSHNGLFALKDDSFPILLKEGKATRSDARNNMAHRFEWHLYSECHSGMPETGLFRIKIDGEEELPNAQKLPPHPDNEDQFNFRVQHDVMISAKDGTTKIATLEFRTSRALDDWKEIPDSDTPIRVEWGAWDHVKDYTLTLTPWLFAAHSTVFAGLALASRRSRWSWRLLTDPFWGRIGAWFWLLMRHYPLAQRWMLSRWFTNVRSQITPEAYLAMPLDSSEQEDFMSSEFVNEISAKKRIWLQGVAGMGKTALVQDLLAGYFCDSEASTLHETYSKYGYVPLALTLRDFAAVPVPHAPEEWLFDVASRAMEAFDVRVDDQLLFRSILTTGYFVLILDGANEVDDGGAITQFARRYPAVGLVVTSQSDPSPEALDLFEVWRLPKDISNAAQPLLELYLGSTRGSATFAAVQDSAIRDDLRSGYDIRLIADLVEAGMDMDSLPKTRVGLYETMLGTVSGVDGSSYPLPDLCKVAWSSWSKGRRDLVPEDNISTSLLNPLQATGVRILRTFDGKAYEFRHDQMRGYLAARWAARHEVAPINLFEEDDQIWRLARHEQKIVWEFFAELISPDAGRPILDWSTQEAERAELQVALRRIAQRDEWLIENRLTNQPA